MAKRVKKKSSVQLPPENYMEDIGEQSQEVQEFVEKKKQKPKKQKASLFGKLKRNTQPQPTEEDDEEAYMEQPQPQNRQQEVQQQPPQYQQQAPQQQRPQVPQQQRPQQNTRAPHGKPTQSSVAKVYSQHKLEQNVFMYMAPSFFLGAQQYYNKNYDNIKVLGTSSLDLLLSEFSTKTLCNAILIFILSANEVRPIHHFLSTIGLKDVDRRLLTVYMVVREGIDVSDLVNDPELSDYISLSEYIKIDKDHPFTTSMLDKAISGVVQNQPMYTDADVKSFNPSSCRLQKKEQSLASAYKYDVKRLRERAEQIKKDMYQNKDKANLVEALASKGTQDIEKQISSLEHIKLIEEVEKEITANIETMKRSPHMRNEIKELISNKFLVSTYKAKEVEALMSEIMAKVEAKLEVYDQSNNSFNRNMFKELNDMKADAREIVAKRTEVINASNRKCAEYKALVNLIENGQVMQARYLGNTCKELSAMLVENQAALPVETVNIISNQLKTMKLEVDEIKKQKSATEERLATMINTTNALLKQIGAIVECDTIVINKLCDIIEAQGNILDSNQPTGFKELMFNGVASAIVDIDGSGLSTILRTVASEKELVLYFGEDCEISDNQIELKEFLSTSWVPETYQVVNVNPRTYEHFWENNKNIDRVIAKLNFVSKYFNNIFIIYHVPLESKFMADKLFNRLVGEVGAITYAVQPTMKYAITVNMLHNSLLDNLGTTYAVQKIITLLNKIDNNYYESIKEDFNSALGFQTKNIKIPYREDIASGQLTDQALLKLKAIKNYLH